MLNWNIRSSLKPVLNISEEKEAFDDYEKTIHSDEIGFFRLPNSRDLLLQSKKVYDLFKHKKYFVHVGIGGSALGPEMLISGLGKDTNCHFTFINNIDPDDLFKKLQKINLKESLIYVVSKSGTTAETVAAMAILINQLKEHGIHEDSFKDYFVFCTDPEKGELRKLSKEWGVHTLDIPSNIGGRFSVLTPVGFLPGFFAGINNEALLQGAQNFQKELLPSANPKSFYELASWIKSLHDAGINQTVLMPYSSLLKDYSSWFVQLWAESLGKEGKGLTPIPAYGATDQHSQMQLFMEGPNNKAIFIIEVKSHKTNYSLKNTLNAESFKNLSPFSLSDLMKAELEGTLSALKENDRHVVHMSIPKLDEESLGQLIIFAESLTALVGKLLKVNPFNQPGVEAGKKYANDWLKNH